MFALCEEYQTLPVSSKATTTNLHNESPARISSRLVETDISSGIMANELRESVLRTKARLMLIMTTVTSQVAVYEASQAISSFCYHLIFVLISITPFYSNSAVDLL
jgi:hypothetical protein